MQSIIQHWGNQLVGGTEQTAAKIGCRSDDMDVTSTEKSLQCSQDFASSILLVKILKPPGPPWIPPSPPTPGRHPAATRTPARSRCLDAPGQLHGWETNGGFTGKNVGTSFPDAQCMEYLSTFTPKHCPSVGKYSSTMEHLGNQILKSSSHGAEV